MSGIQRFFQRILPKSWAARMEASSRAWMMRCGGCGSERSVWEAGGIRWGAAGNPKRRLRCPRCGQLTWHTLYKKQPEDAAQAS